MSLRVVSRKMPWSLLKVRQGTNTKTLMPSETLIKISASIATRQNMGQPNWIWNTREFTRGCSGQQPTETYPADEDDIRW